MGTPKHSDTVLVAALIGGICLLGGCAGKSPTPQGAPGAALGATAGHTALGIGTGAGTGILGGTYLYDQHEKAKQGSAQAMPAADPNSGAQPQSPWAARP